MHPVERPHLPAGRFSFGHLALEAVMIAFGVLLALSLESWREHGKQQALAREALANIHTEIARDVERIKRQLPWQQELAGVLQGLEKDFRAGKGRPPSSLALHPPALSAAAWNTAMSTQALAHMEFRTVQTLAAFYETQRWLERIEDAWLRLMTEPRGGTAEASAQWAGSMLNTLYSYMEIENSLLKEAREATPDPPQE